MNHYIELTLIPDLEVDLNFIWAKVYAQIHLGLVRMQDANKAVPIGVSFPEYAYERFLGKKLRLFANDEATLNRFNVSKCLERLTDYIHISSVRAVVASQIKGYVQVKRYHQPASLGSLARRYAKRHLDTSVEGALHRLNGYKVDNTHHPYIHLSSLSGKKAFSLFICQTQASEWIEGVFNTYGFSERATLPHF
jgi:CRISPR-associated endonuclease Csy4